MTATWRNVKATPEDARAFLRNQLAESATGAGRLVFVSGGIASGKTELQNEFLDHAERAGAITLSATGAPDEEHIDGAIIDQLLANSSLPAEVLERLDTLLPTGEHGHLSTDQNALRTACRMLLDVARDEPMVIAVDDVHFADETSLKILLHLQRRIRSTRLLMVLNQPDRPLFTQRRLRAHFAKQPHYVLQLTPMSEKTISELLTRSLDCAVATDLPTRIHALSAGNPMLANALVDDYREIGRADRPVIGTAFGRAVLAFLDRPDAPLHAVAGAVAVLGPHSGVDVVAKLTGVDVESVTDMFDMLTSCGLLDDGRFRHGSVENAVLDSLAPTEKSRLHAAAAQLKYQRAATATEVAGHLIAAGEIPEPWAIPVLRVAADQGSASEQTRFATQCLELAISASTDDSEQRMLRQALVTVTWRVNPSAASSYLTALRADGDHNADSFALARHALWHGDRDTFARAREALRPTLDAQADAELSLAHHWTFGPAGTANPPSTPWNHTAATLAGVWQRGGSDATNACAERILQNCRLGDGTLEALTTAIMALMHGGRADRAERWCAMLSKEADERGALTWRAMLDAVWSGIVLRRGEITAAAERARAALDLLDEPGWGVAISYPLTTLLLADVAAGNFDAAARTLARPVPDALFETIGGLGYLRARGRFYLATNRPLAAISDFQKCQQLMHKWDVDSPKLVPWRGDLAEVNLRLGNLARARELARQQLDVASGVDAYACGVALRVLAYVSEQAERPGFLDRAAKSFKEAGDQLEYHRTQRAIAQLSGQHQRGALRPVRPIATPAPAPRKPVDPEPRESAMISTAELRVAQLAAMGRTNRQIGSQLFITVSTVEQHLTRVYKKLGISGRSSLSAELHSQQPVVDDTDNERRAG